MFGCAHLKVSELKPDGFQYCLRCNRALRPATTEPAKVPASHIWEAQGENVIERFISVDGERKKLSQTLIQLRCTRCGIRVAYNKVTGFYESPAAIWQGQCTV